MFVLDKDCFINSYLAFSLMLIGQSWGRAVL